MTDIKQKLKKKLYIVIVALAVTVIFYFYLFSVVREKQNTGLNSAISDLGRLESKQSNFSLNSRILDETTAERARLNSFILDKKTVADFIQQIEDLGKHANVEITKSLSVEKNPQKPKENILKFNVRAKGTLKDVYYFTLLTENLPYKIRVKKMAISTSDADTSSFSSGVMGVLEGKKKTAAVPSVWVSDINFEVISYINE